MTYAFDSFCADCRQAYDPSTGNADLETVRQNLERLIKDNPEYVLQNCGDDAEAGVHELYKDAERGFIVYAHINPKGRTSPPHDHGASWAVYGQVNNFTDMTEYDRLDDKSKEGHAEIAQSKKYRLEPGMVGKFGPHAIHQIHFGNDTRFIRVTGSDLFVEDTLTYDPDNKAVSVIGRGSAASNDGKVKVTTAA